MSCFSRLPIFVSFLVTGCAYSYGTPAPVPVVLAGPAPAHPVERCEPTPEPIVPSGQTPLPTAEGELSFLDWRGDDRLTVNGYVSFTWSNDGETLISGSNDGVMFWNASTGGLERRIRLPSRIESPLRLSVSPDGKWVAFVAYMLREDQTRIEAPGFFLMRTDGQGEVRRFDKTGDQVSFTADGKRLANHAHVWDLEKGTETEVKPFPFKHETKYLPGYERALVFEPNDKVPKEAVFPELRETISGKVLHRFPLLETSIGAALSGDGKRIALLQKGVLSVYSTETFELLLTISNVGKAQMVHLSEDGHRAVTETLMCAVALSSDAQDMSWCPSPELTLWDLDKKEILIRTPRGSGDGWVFSPDGEYLTGPDTRLVDYIVHIRDGKELRFGTRIRTISPGSRRVLYDGKLGFELAALDGKSPVPVIQRGVRTHARSADGHWKVVQANDGRIRLESTTSCWKLPYVVPSYGDPRTPFDYWGDDTQVAFSPDASSLFVVTTSYQARFRAFDTQTGQLRWGIQADVHSPAVAQILPLSNQVLFQGSEHPDVRRFQATTGLELPKGGAPRLIYYTPPTGGGYTYDVRGHNGIRAANLWGIVGGKDGIRVAMSGILDNKCALSIWDLRNPRNVDDRFVGCLSAAKALSPDEKWLAAGAEHNQAAVIALDHDEIRRIDKMHEGKTTAIVFTPAGDRLVHADDLGNIVVADPWEGRIKGKATLPLDHAKRLWVSADGGTLVVDTVRGLQVRFRMPTHSLH